MAITVVSYVNKKNANGTHSSTYTINCDVSEATATQAAMLLSTDANDNTLKCQSAQITHLPSDDQKFSGKAQIVCQYEPVSKIAKETVGSDFQVEWEYDVEVFSYAGGYKWASDSKDIDPDLNLLPTWSQTLIRCHLSGVRSSSWNISNISTYLDKINSDNPTWLGAPAGTVLFVGKGTRITLRNDGNKLVQLELVYRPNTYTNQDGWNSVWRSDKGKWDKPKSKDDNSFMYASTSFANLLSV